jgi:hypothetical protein
LPCLCRRLCRRCCLCRCLCLASAVVFAAAVAFAGVFASPLPFAVYCCLCRCLASVVACVAAALFRRAPLTSRLSLICHCVLLPLYSPCSCLLLFAVALNIALTPNNYRPWPERSPFFPRVTQRQARHSERPQAVKNLSFFALAFACFCFCLCFCLALAFVLRLPLPSTHSRFCLRPSSPPGFRLTASTSFAA